MDKIFSFNSDDIFNTYENYKEKTLTQRRFNHKMVLDLINKFRTNSKFDLTLLGHSIENREIYKISIGSGPINILSWSQMHGNESTATMAIFDLLNFFESDDFSDLQNGIFEKITLHFIPMLNPDGAERFTRENAVNIDLNRDAVKLACPESVILKNAIMELNPLFGFNLHDQKIYYSSGYSSKSASISFLAPAYNSEKEINDVRKRAMQLIGSLSQKLQDYIPNSVAKYDDEFEPRAFGDNIMKWNTSTVLIESGGYPNDPEKQFIRKINYLTLLYSFYSIATYEYNNFTLDVYNKIPENRERLLNLKIKNVLIKKSGKLFNIDIGINRSEITKDNSSYTLKSQIEDIGDLSTFYGYEEFDAKELILQEAKIFESELHSFDESEIKNLIKSGYLFLKSQENINIINTFYNNCPNSKIELETPANFYLTDENKNLKYAIINGFLVNLELDDFEVPNCINFG